MRIMLVVLCGLLFCAELLAHSSQELVCDFTMLDGMWTVYYPEGATSEIEEYARLSLDHVGTIAGEEMFDARLDGSRNWKTTDRGISIDCSNSDGLLIQIPIKRISDSEDFELCVQRVANLVGLMKRVGHNEPNLRQVGLVVIDDGGTCTPGIIGPRTPGHAHADD